MKCNLMVGALVLVLGGVATAAPVTVQAQDVAPPALADDGDLAAGMQPRGAFFDFARIDADADGKVTQEELRAYRSAAVTGVDQNGDGLISETELTADIAARMTARAAEMARARIAAKDVDGDGQLNVEEALARPMPVAMFGRIDADGDGAISQAEFDAAAEQMKDRHGRRGDGRRRGHGHGFGQGHGQGMFGFGGSDNG